MPKGMGYGSKSKPASKPAGMKSGMKKSGGMKKGKK